MASFNLDSLKLLSDLSIILENGIARVIAENNMIGPSIALKIMAGDKINIRVSSWYKLEEQTPNGDFNDIFNDLASTLSSEISSISGKATALVFEEAIANSVLPGFLEYQENNYNSSKPQASLNYIYLIACPDSEAYREAVQFCWLQFWI